MITAPNTRLSGAATAHSVIDECSFRSSGLPNISCAVLPGTEFCAVHQARPQRRMRDGGARFSP